MTETKAAARRGANGGRHRERAVLITGGARFVGANLAERLVDPLSELLAEQKIEALRGQAFNLGGGPGNVISLLELLELAATLDGGAVPLRHAPSRVGDQPYYVSNHTRFSALTGWRPRVDVASGVRALHEWLLSHRLRSEHQRITAAEQPGESSARGASS